jgi:hypothetical protein
MEEEPNSEKGSDFFTTQIGIRKDDHLSHIIKNIFERDQIFKIDS